MAVSFNVSSKDGKSETEVVDVICSQNMGYKGSLDAQRNSEDVRQGTKVYTLSDRNVRRGAYAKSSWPGTF